MQSVNTRRSLKRTWGKLLLMNKGILPAILLGGALFSTPALAAKNVANTSQKGSLLIYPKISVDPADNQDTMIEISNDDNAGSVQVECYYINEAKDRVDFDFTLTSHETASWDVGTGAGDQVNPPPFPSGGTFTPGDPNRGELICFATDPASQKQIAWNQLTGTATVMDTTGTGLLPGDGDATQPLQAYRYNAFAFAAESSTGLAANGTVMGVPGHLVLSGAGAGTYDACPQYNIANFMPGEGATPGVGGSRLGNIYTIDNDLTTVSCNQDLRQDWVLHLTKLQFTVWNSKEQSYTGAYACVDSTNQVPLNVIDEEEGGVVVHDITNFSEPTLTTPNARFQVQGVASTQCPGSESAGLLGVLTSSVNVDGTGTGEDAELGSTTQGAGFQAGFVLWDPSGSGVTPQGPTTR